MRIPSFVRAAFAGVVAVLALPAAPTSWNVLTMADNAPADIAARQLSGDGGLIVSAAEIKVENRSGSELSYDLSLVASSGHSVGRKLTVPANATRYAVLVVPTGDGSSFEYPSVFANGPGTSGSGVGLSSASRTSGAVQIGMSSRLHANYAGRWKQEVGGGSSGHDKAFVAEVNVARMPGDWRVWRGLRSIVLTDEDWREACATPASRETFYHYAGQGGRVSIIAEKSSVIPGVPAGKDRVRFGFGEIVAYRTDAGSAMTAFEKNPASGPFSYPADIAPAISDRPLEKRLSPAARAGLGVVAIIVLFAVIAGPVNLFVFCRGPRRHRMLWLTPLIATGFSAVIMTYVFVADGTGGEGVRRRLRLRPAGTTSEFLVQEQSSRTGLVVSGAFEIPDNVLIRQAFDPSSVTFRREANYRRFGDDASGDWFRSRYVQTQTLEAWRSERGGVEIAGTGDAVKIRSTADGTLAKVFVRTASGAVRVAENVSPGATVPTRAATDIEFRTWLSEVTKDCSVTQSGRLLAVAKTPGMWFAESSDLRAGAPDTLPAIRWKNLPDILVGDLSPAAGTAE